MAKRKRSADQTAEPATQSSQEAQTGNGSPQTTAPAESIQGYFRRILEENPKLLKGRSNQALLDRWLADHPGFTEVPQSVKNGLSNVKSLLRRKGRKRKPRQEGEAGQEGHGLQEAEATQEQTQTAEQADTGLECLEAQIDECLMLARSMDREGLGNVIALLRGARNEVVWKLGE